MKKEQRIALCEQHKISESQALQLEQVEKALNLDFGRLIALFVQYGPVFLEILASLGLIKPATPPAA